MATVFQSSYARPIATSDTAELFLTVHLGFGGLEKLVLVKRLLQKVRTDERYLQAFIQAARQAAMLNHHHIAEIYDVQHDEASTFLVSEYVSGEDLGYIMRATAAKRQSMPVPIACRIISQAAAGVHHGHQAADPEGEPLNLYHGDLSPNNIIVDYAGVTKVTDYGLGRADPRNTHSSPSGRLVKLAYRAPEQVEERSLDHRVDVYALGVLLYELLVGRPLFWDNESNVRDRVLQLKVPPPSRLNPEVPAELDELVLAAINRDPQQRTEGAQRFHEQLGEFLVRNRTYASEHEVSAWLVSTLKTRRSERQQMERAVFAESRKRSMGAALSTVGSDNVVQQPATPGLTAGSSSVGAATGGSQVTGQAPVDLAPSGRRSSLLYFGLGTGIVLLLAIAAVVGYAMFFTSSGNVEDTNQAMTPGDSPAALVVHVSPEDCTVSVNGAVRSTQVGEDGVLVPVPPRKVAKIEVSKKGYEQHTQDVPVPSLGSKHVYVNLTALPPPKPPTRLAQAADAGAPRSTSRSKRSTARRTARASRRSGSTLTGRTAAAKARRRRSSRVATRAPKPKVPVVTGGVITVSFSPSDGKVTIDGVLRQGSSPVRVEELPLGGHTVVVSATGHRTHTASVRLEEGAAAKSLNIELRRKDTKAPVAILSTPPGAELLVDGKSYGRTPVYGLRLTHGKTYQVIIARVGFRHWSAKFEVKEEGPNRLVAYLQPHSLEPLIEPAIGEQ